MGSNIGNLGSRRRLSVLGRKEMQIEGVNKHLKSLNVICPANTFILTAIWWKKTYFFLYFRIPIRTLKWLKLKPRVQLMSQNKNISKLYVKKEKMLEKHYYIWSGQGTRGNGNISINRKEKLVGGYHKGFSNC